MMVMIEYVGLFFSVFAILLGFLWYKMTKSHIVNQHGFKISRDKDGLLQRELGNMERYFAAIGFDESGIVVSAALITSKVSLEPKLMQKAFALVNRRFPLLRMTIYRKNNTLWFQEMADPSKIAFELCKEYTASQWINVYERESRVAFDNEKGPLWRVTLLKEEYDNKQEFYTNSFVFAVSHAIYDGGSRIAIISQLLEYLKDLYQGKHVQVESKPLLPPLSYLIRAKVQVSTLEKVIFKVLPTFTSIKNKFVKPAKNRYLQTYPPPILHNPSIVKRTSLVTRMIVSEQLSKIAKIGKEHGCTVHSVITAATRLAIAKILKMGSTKTYSDIDRALSFDSTFNVSARMQCQPIVEQNEVGCFICFAKMNIETPCFDTKVTPEAFWEYASACKDAVSKTISKEEHFRFFKCIHSINPEDLSGSNSAFSADESNAGRAAGLFNISNLGRFAIDDKDVPFQIKGSYEGSAEQGGGPVFSHNMVSINGVLYWAISYFPHVTTKQQAEQFLDMSISILKDACEL